MRSRHDDSSTVFELCRTRDKPSSSIKLNVKWILIFTHMVKKKAYAMYWWTYIAVNKYGRCGLLAPI